MAGGSTAAFVWIKLATAKDDVFAYLKTEGAAFAGQVSALACAGFPRWRLDAGQVHLHLVAGPGAAVPTPAAIDAALALAPLAVSAGVDSGAWLVAVPTAPAAAPAAAVADPVALLTAFHAPPLNARQQDTLRHHDALAGDRALLTSHTFATRHLFLLLKKLESVAASSTRLRLASRTGIVLDGPVNGAKAQAGTSILLALMDGQVLCAKVGSSAAVAQEWQVSQAIHASCAAPAVMKVLLHDTVPSEHGQSLLLMPLYPMSAAAALLVLTAEHSAGPQRLRCRDTLAALVAMCGLAGIAAFARAGLAHGDIKPGNIMLTGGAAGVAPCVLIDFGAALPLGQGLREFSHQYGLEHEPAATLSYDLACLASTLALVQYDLLLPVGDGTGGALLAALQALDGAAWHPAEAPRPPGSLAAEACLRLSYLACSSSAGLDLRELRLAAEAVADAASAAGLRVPPVASVWGSGGEG